MPRCHLEYPCYMYGFSGTLIELKGGQFGKLRRCVASIARELALTSIGVNQGVSANPQGHLYVHLGVKVWSLTETRRLFRKCGNHS